MNSTVTQADTVVSAFSEEHVHALTGISVSQLRYWDRTDFFRPAFADDNRRVAFSRIYSFRDVAELRVLNTLRNESRVSLQHLRQAARELAALSDARWTATSLYVLNRRVVFLEPGTDRYREVVGAQYVLGIPLAIVTEQTREAVKALQARGDADVGKIERRRNVNHNAIVVAGTRIPVASVKRLLEDGYSVSQVVAEYPTLTEADVKAAEAYKHKHAKKAA